MGEENIAYLMVSCEKIWTSSLLCPALLSLRLLIKVPLLLPMSARHKMPSVNVKTAWDFDKTCRRVKMKMKSLVSYPAVKDSIVSVSLLLRTGSCYPYLLLTNNEDPVSELGWPRLTAQDDLAGHSEKCTMSFCFPCLSSSVPVSRARLWPTCMHAATSI